MRISVLTLLDLIICDLIEAARRRVNDRKS